MAAQEIAAASEDTQDGDLGLDNVQLEIRWRKTSASDTYLVLFAGIPAAKMIRDCSAIKTQLLGSPSCSEIDSGRRVVTIVGADHNSIIRVLRDLHCPSLGWPLIDGWDHANGPRSTRTYQTFKVFDAATALGCHSYVRTFQSILSDDLWTTLPDLKKLVKHYGIHHAYAHIAAYRLVSRVVRFGNINEVLRDISRRRYPEIRELVSRLAAVEENVERDNRRYRMEQEAEREAQIAGRARGYDADDEDEGDGEGS